MDVTYSSAAWRAAAHPLRRRLIELLRDGPRTTGDLARAFPVTRFAVMKHLRTLERCGIVSVDRRGRESWNTLTLGGPLELTVTAVRQDHNPADTPARHGLNAADTTVGRGFPGLSGVEGSPAQVPAGLLPFRIEQRVLLSVPPGRVFDAFTFNVSAWWGAPYLRSDAATNLVLEPHLGGRFVEEWGHRQGFIRGIVTAIRQDERLEIAGRIAGAGCIPALLELDLRATDRGTRLTLVHRGVVEPSGDGPPDVQALYERAWGELVGERLKAFVERGVRSGIAERPAPAGTLLGWF